MGDNAIESFAVTIAVNLNGAYYMSQCALPSMTRGTSTIIHMSSTRALQSEPNTEAYSASKAGLLGLTHSQVWGIAGQVQCAEDVSKVDARIIAKSEQSC